MTNQLTTRPDVFPPAVGKDANHRQAKYLAWLQQSARPWYTPDLAAYRDHLAGEGLQPSSISSHLSTVRSMYRVVIANRELFYRELITAPMSPADQKATVDEALARLTNAIAPEAAKVKTITHQDRPDSDHLRLTTRQAEALLAAPDPSTPKGLRDLSLLAVLLATGIREGEAHALNVDDLRQVHGGELALYVRKGKGDKARLIPWGGLDFALVVVDKWLELAGIDAGAVFRSLRKGDHITDRRLSTRAIQDITKSYPVVVDGQRRQVKPHDLRRTYARLCYEGGLGLEEIRQNLGHSSSKTTQNYIGVLSAAKRRPAGFITFDVGKLG